nr:YdcF family protein [Lachnospiraceae bacterium]
DGFTGEGDYETECDFYCDILIKNGVLSEHILREDKATFTKENGVFSQKVLSEANVNVRKAMIVCKAFHARRCLIYYANAFKNCDLRVIPVPEAYPDTVKDNWFKSKRGTRRVLSELAKCSNQCAEDLRELISGQGIQQS